MNYSKNLHTRLSYIGVWANFCILAAFNTTYAFIYSIAYLGIKYLCPLVLVSVFEYKNEIAGPWDIPVVTNYQPQNA